MRVAKEAALEGGKGTIIAGAVGPTGEGAGFIDDDKQAELSAAYEEQISAQVRRLSKIFVRRGNCPIQTRESTL